MTKEPPLAPPGAGRALSAVTKLRTARHELALYADPGPFFEALRTAIGVASRRVWLETYIYRDDALGASFAELMAAAARRGVDVRLLYDPQGSRKARSSFFGALAAAGVGVRAYRPWRPTRRRWTYWPRDHGRVVIVDDDAHTGGVNWGREWLPREQGGEGWHDVTLGVRGPAVRDFEAAFLLRWAEASARGAVADHVGEDGADVQLIADSPARPSVVLQQLCASIDSARRRVWIENSYCVPPLALLRALARAAGRGVQVRVLVPGVSDLPSVRAASRGEYWRWLRVGVEVYEYQGRVMHSKFALVDDAWGTVGTFNAISAGVWWANETNVVVRDRGAVAALACVFEDDLARSRRVTEGALEARRCAERLWEGALAALYRAAERLAAWLRG